MQITVNIRPEPPEGFVASYPRLARTLEAIAPGLAGAQPSPYALAGRVDELVDALQGTRLGELFAARRDALHGRHDRAEALAAEWKLAEADQLLYQLEDLFDELEADLRAG